MHSYTAYGLTIGSEFPLPEFTELEAPSANTDVTISFGSFELRPIHPSPPIRFILRGQQDARIAIHQTGALHITGGSAITVALAPQTMLPSIIPFIMGVGIGMLLYQRGLLLLHGSAVAVDGGVVGFLGNKGQGKSVTAAGLHQRGYPLVTDDIIAIDPVQHLIYPAASHIRLWPDAVEAFGHDPDLMPQIHPDRRKRRLHVETGTATLPLPLRHLFILAAGEAINITRLTPITAFQEIMTHAYAARWLTSTAPNPHHFMQCTSLVHQVPVSQFTRPRSFEMLAPSLQAVEHMLKISA